MADDLKIWLPPMLTLLGTLIVVVFTAWMNNRAILATIRGDNAELKMWVQGEINALKLDLLRIENKLDRVIETQASHSGRLDKLEGGRK